MQTILHRGLFIRCFAKRHGETRPLRMPLERRKAITVNLDGMTTLVCLKGQIWVTMTGGRDIVLTVGRSTHFPSGSAVVIEGLEDSTVQIH